MDKYPKRPENGGGEENKIFESENLNHQTRRNRYQKQYGGGAVIPISNTFGEIIKIHRTKLYSVEESLALNYKFRNKTNTFKN